MGLASVGLGLKVFSAALGIALTPKARAKPNAAMTADGVEALRQYRTAFDEKGKIFADTPHCDWTTDIADAARATWQSPRAKSRRR